MFTNEDKEETDEEEGNTSYWDEETETAMDELKKYIEYLKEELEIEKAKVKSLSKVNKEQNENIESLQNKTVVQAPKTKPKI